MFSFKTPCFRTQGHDVRRRCIVDVDRCFGKRCEGFTDAREVVVSVGESAGAQLP